MATNYIEIVTDGAVIEIDDGSSIVDVNSNSEITVEYSGDSKDANAIRGRTIETGTPADQEVLTWNNSASEWQYQTVDENVDDQVASLIQASSGNGITWTYDDSAGTLTPTLSIKNADVNASAAIAVSKLAASTVNYGGVTLTLGGSDTTPAFNLSDATSYVGDSSLVTTGAVDSGSITSGHGSIDIGSSALTAGTATFTQVDITAEGDLRLQDASGGQYVGLDAPSTVSTSYTLTMPSAVGSSQQSLRTSDAGGTLEWFTPGDIEGITTASNSGLAGGATSGTPSLSLDMNNLTAASVNVANDSIAIIDADASNGTRKESIADLFAAVDGTGLTASSGVLSVDASQTQITAVGTIGTGTWQGSEIGLGYGGTELVGETDGKIVVADGSGAPVHLDIGSSTAITILGTVATGTWQGSSISTSYTDAKVTSVVAGTAVDVSGTTGDVTVNVDLSELATSTTDGDGDYFVVVDASDVSRKLTKGNISLAGFTGTAATATLASTVTVVDSSDTTAFPAFFDSATGSLAIKTDASGLTYNASSGVLSATFSGNITGNVTGNTSGSSGSCTGNSATATALETARTIGGTSFDGTANIVPGTITVGDTTDTSSYVALFESATGSLAPKTDAAITYNAGTGVLSATFSGDLTGDVTGDVSGSSGSCTGNAATATVASTSVVVDSSDTTAFPAFFDSATGSLAIKTDASGLTYNASTGVLTSTFAGNLTGNVTGNTSGSSGSTTGNAATATALETARTIGGTSFDGTANIAVGLAAEATTLETARTIGGTSFDGSANIVPATITVADTTDTSCSVGLFESATGDLAPKSDGGLTYNAGTGTLTATAFAGPLTGNVTGNASGTAGVATTVTITDNESTNEDNGLVFTSGGTLTGNLGLESDGTMTYNPSTGKITATGFIGALTGDASGNAATATALETARTINGVSFDGTANVTVTAAAGTLSGGTLNSGVTASSLTSVGTLTSVTTSGDITMDATDKFYLDGGGNTYIHENSADSVQVVAGGTATLTANDAGIAVPATSKIWLDNGGNTYLRESSADVVTLTTEGTDSFLFATNGGNPYIRIQALNTGVGAVQYYEDDGGSGQVLHFQAGVRGADNKYYISSNATIHSSYALRADGQDIDIGGALSKASGSFKIDHVLPSMESTHDLYHSFVESSEAMLIYRGKTELVNGQATIQMDDEIGLTTGTFELLVRDAQVYTTNETSWDRVRGSIDGSTLTIQCEDSDCSDVISWLVVGERMDKHMMETSWTDDNGRPILEREKPPEVEDAVS
tara:strand:- start:4601 stop:8443 length:3843 start_codon:yes stop_codon:yes gene_type:complete